MNGEIDSIASRFESRWLRGYVRAKVKGDPVYEAVWEALEGSVHPLLDVGCGIGVLELFLRYRGFDKELLGVDTDAEKISIARKANTTSISGTTRFELRDARDGFGEFLGNVALLDVLHYMSSADQSALLEKAADCVAPKGLVIIRDCPRDGSWRYRATYLEEAFAKAIGWLKVPFLNFPTMDVVEGPFRSRGFHVQVRPLWGRTPYNNHLWVFRRP